VITSSIRLQGVNHFVEEKMPNYQTTLYELSTGNHITDLSRFSSPIEEYRAAFAERSSPFLTCYTFQDGDIHKHSLTRGEFWDLVERQKQKGEKREESKH